MAWPPRSKPFIINGRIRSLPCYLVDGIYPPYALFIYSYGRPVTYKQKTFNRLQEAPRKDIVRLFAVLTSRYYIALHWPGTPRSQPSVPWPRWWLFLHNRVTQVHGGGYLAK